MIPNFFYESLSFLKELIWLFILFYCGTLLQKNKDVFNYFNVSKTDVANHLVNERENSFPFDPTKIIASIGTLLKVYAILAIILLFFRLTRFFF